MYQSLSPFFKKLKKKLEKKSKNVLKILNGADNAQPASVPKYLFTCKSSIHSVMVSNIQVQTLQHILYHCLHHNVLG